MSGGTYTLTNGAVMTVAGAGGGTLSNVAMGGEIRIPVGAIMLAGTTSFAAARLSVGNTTVRVAPGATFSGEIIAEGAATGTRTVQFAFGGNGTGTIGASGVIRLDPTSGGPLTVNGSSDATLINNGTILAGGTQTLTLAPNILTNNGTLRVTGGTMSLSPTTSYTNPGTIDVEGGTLNLGSTFNATSGIGTWERSGGTVNVTGTLTNTGSTIALSASTGSWNLSGGNINGGSMTTAEGASLVLTSGAGTLTNLNYGADLTLPTGTAVTLSGTVTFPTIHMTGASFLRIAPGGTTNGVVVAEGAATGTRTVQFAFGGNGTGTIGASGVIRLDATSGGPLTISESSNATLVNNGLIHAGGTQAVSILTNTLTNNGTLRVTSGALSVTPQTSWTNSGTIDVEGGTLNLGSTWNTTAGIGTWDRSGGTVNVTGTITNTGSAIALDASTGSWNLSGGTISGGTLSQASGAVLGITSLGGVLSNVSLTNDLSSPANTSVQLAGSTRFATARLTGPNSTLRFSPGYTLHDGVVAEGAAPGTRFVTGAYGGNGSLTISATGSVRLAPGTGGNLTFGQSSSATVTNNGIIAAEAAGRTLTLSVDALSNLAAGTLSGGEWVATNGAALNLGTGRNVATNSAVIRVDGATSSVSGLATLASNTGTLTLAGGRDLTVPAFSNAGTPNLGPASQLTVNGVFTQTTTGTLNLVLGGNAAADLARVVASGNVNLAGGWTVGGITEFPPAYGEVFDLVTGVARFGNFASFTSGFVPAGVFVELYSGTAARAAFDRRAGVWTGAGDGITWSDPANWFNNALPTSADTAYIGLPALSPTIHITPGTQTVGSVVSTEAIVIDAGATLSLVGNIQARFDAAFTNSGLLDSDTDVFAGGGGTHTRQFVMADGTTLSLAGSHALAGGSSISGAATVSVLGGDSTFGGSLSAAISLTTASGATAILTQNYSLAAVENAGSLEIASRTITVAGAFNQAETGSLGVDLVSESVVGSIAAASSSLAGSISLTTSGGFDPSNPMIPLYGISIVNAQSVTGSAPVTTQPTLTVGSFVARVQGNALRLLHNVADFNGDRGVDADDVIAYFTAWDNGDLIADLNGDGGVDSDDVIFFFGFWDLGGR